MAIIRINYDEGNKENLGYESVKISYGKIGERIFNSGNFVKDWYDMRKFMLTELSKTEPHFTQSSSVDHFFMDGASYDSAYLHIIDKIPTLKYIDKSDPNYLDTQHDIYEEGIEFFVEENTKPTWVEFKELFK